MAKWYFENADSQGPGHHRKRAQDAEGARVARELRDPRLGAARAARRVDVEREPVEQHRIPRLA